MNYINKKLQSGVFAALAAAALFGASTPYAKLLVTQISPWLLAALLYLGSCIGLWIVRVIIISTHIRAWLKHAESVKIACRSFVKLRSAKLADSRHIFESIFTEKRLFSITC